MSCCAAFAPAVAFDAGGNRLDASRLLLDDRAPRDARLDFFADAEVAAIVVEAGASTGVALADGRAELARRPAEQLPQLVVLREHVRDSAAVVSGHRIGAALDEPERELGPIALGGAHERRDAAHLVFGLEVGAGGDQQAADLHAPPDGRDVERS